MTTFVLNDKIIQTHQPQGMTLLDFVRYHKHLIGTKIGCREGDCGACNLLMGELIDGKVYYKSLTSCITPLGNAQGKHIVSIEGLNMDELTPYQQAMVDESGSQCGICTVGFIVSFAGECLAYRPNSYESVIGAIDGNICRCTGYKSIERAANIVYNKLKNKDVENPVAWLVKHKFIPEYFLNIPKKISQIATPAPENGHVIVGGGTDLFVQKHDEIYESSVNLISDNKHLTGIRIESGKCIIGAATNATQMLESKVLNDIFPNLYTHLKLVSSTPIRNIGTVAGNFINASPIGDLTAFFIALNSTIHLKNKSGNTRFLLLKDLYKGYKILDKTEDEYITHFSFEIPDSDTYFNFEKVSKRTYLDIASVNTAMRITVQNDYIKAVHISAGGVAPIPKYLQQTCEYLTGKHLTENTILEALEVMQNEVAPISDARGAKEYKRLLLRQLVFAHFMELFPEKFELAMVG